MFQNIVNKYKSKWIIALGDKRLSRGAGSFRMTLCSIHIINDYNTYLYSLLFSFNYLVIVYFYDCLLFRCRSWKWRFFLFSLYTHTLYLWCYVLVVSCCLLSSFLIQKTHIKSANDGGTYVRCIWWWWYFCIFVVIQKIMKFHFYFILNTHL